MYRPIFPIMLFPSTSHTFPILLSSSRISSQFHFWKDFSGVAMVDHPHIFNTEFPLSGQFFTNPGSNQDWLVVYLPLWKILVKWEYYSNIWKVIKFHGSSHHQPRESVGSKHEHHCHVRTGNGRTAASQWSLPSAPHDRKIWEGQLNFIQFPQ